MVTMNKYTTLLLLTCLALSMPACFVFTSKKQGDELRAEVEGLEERMSKMESELADERQHLTEMIDRAREEVDKLEETLNRATRVLARNNADFGAEMESVKSRIREIDGSLAEINHQVEMSTKSIEKTEKRLVDFALAAGLDIPVDQSTVPSKPEDHYQAIKDSHASGRYGEARSFAREFLKRYPKRTEADDVQLLVAKTYLAQKRWGKALGALRQFTDKYPKSELNPEVLYEMARAFYKLGDCTDARIIIDAITAKYKSGPFVDKAKLLGQEMNNNKSRCTS